MHYIYRYTYDTIVKNVSKYIIELSEYIQVQFTGLIPPLPVCSDIGFFMGQKCGHLLKDRAAKGSHSKALQFILTSFQV